MKIIEALKDLKVIEKRIAKNRDDITKYASRASTDNPLFESDDRQKEEVKRLIQANMDLMFHYLDLKAKIEYTNLVTMVELGGKKWSISQLILLRRGMGKVPLETLNALNFITAKTRLQEIRQIDATDPPKAIQLWDEEQKNKDFRYWQEDILQKIDATLEVTNAQVDLLDKLPA